MGKLDQVCFIHLEKLCQHITDRSVGSEGNRAASRYFENITSALGWKIEVQEFEAMDWIDGGASLSCDHSSFEAFVSPYSRGCTMEAELVDASNVDELEEKNITGKILLLHGEISLEQLMPKNFKFYNPDEHQRIIALLEKGAPLAIICATGRNAPLAGGAYPFPLIEDGDFDIPSVYLTDIEGARLLGCVGKTVSLDSVSTRVKAKGCNVIARKGNDPAGRLVVTAHIDAKKGTPGALDNAGGVVILLLLADLLKDYTGEKQVEIVALNGEDYYAVPGQMEYIDKNRGRFDQMRLNINIDGAGYVVGNSAFSFFDLPEDIETMANEVIQQFDGITKGRQWVQGDHSIFIQNGVPAIAVSSQWFIDHIDSQEITHTPKDNIEIIDCARLVEIAQALSSFILRLNS